MIFSFNYVSIILLFIKYGCHISEKVLGGDFECEKDSFKYQIYCVNDEYGVMYIRREN